MEEDFRFVFGGPVLDSSSRFIIPLKKCHLNKKFPNEEKNRLI